MGVEDNIEEPYFNTYISFHNLDEEEKIRLLTRFQSDLVEYYKYSQLIKEKNKLIIRLKNKLTKLRSQLSEQIQNEELSEE